MSFYVNIMISLAVGLLTSYLAYKRGRDPGVWLFIGTFLGIFALLILFFMKDLSEEPQEKESGDQDIEDKDLLGELNASDETEGAPLVVGNQVLESLNVWYYADANYQQQGPISKTVLLELLAKGEVTKDTLVWKIGLIEWKKLNEVEELV